MAGEETPRMHRKLVITTAPPRGAFDGIGKRFPELEIVDCSADRERVKTEIADAHAAVGAVSAEELARATRLELVQVFSQGVEHLMYPEMRAHPAVVSNGRGVWSPTMGEHILAMLLAIYRRFPGFIRSQQARQWARDGSEPFRYARLTGKTVAMLGTGDIAQYTVELLRPFGCRLIGINRTGRAIDGYDALDDVVRTAAHGAPTDPAGGDPACWRGIVRRLREALPQADALVCSLPNTPETKALLGAEEFALMRETAVFVNVGRGTCVDEPALIAALRDGTIAAAGLDVFAVEPLPEDSPLWGMENVLITPHMSALSPDYIDRVRKILFENLERLRDGRPFLNRVDKTAGY